MKISAVRRPIAVILPSLAGGGAERAMLIFAKGLLDLGHDVDVVLAASHGPLRSLVDGRAKLLDLGSSRVITALPRLCAYLLRHRPCLVFSTMSHMNVVTLLSVQLVDRRIPVVVREANVPLSATKRPDTLSERTVQRLIPLLYPRAKAVIAVSNVIRDELLSISDRLQEKIAVIPNPVVSPDLFSAAEEPVDHPWFAPGGPPVILSVGRLHPQKDFPTLLRAFAELKKVKDCRLLILGEGDERESLEKLASRLNIERETSMPGFVINPFPYMRRAAVFVSSSVYEGMPNSLLQAMALGVPIVATDCKGGAKEVLSDSGLGRIVAAGDHLQMAEAILASIDGKGREAACRFVCEQFGVERSVRSYLATAGLSCVGG